MRKRTYGTLKCLYCEEEKQIRKDHLKVQKFCSISCSKKYDYETKGKESHPQWKGGRRINHNGYVEIHMPEHHRARANGYVFEHIIVLENKIGRRLKKNEQTHHIDENKQNNDPENLQAVDIREHQLITAKSRIKKKVKKNDE